MHEWNPQSVEELKPIVETLLELYPSGAIVCLSGDLGAGKTTFVRELVKVLAAKHSIPVPKVTSPSFVLHQSYPIKPPVEHFDLYRLENITFEGLVELGYFDAADSARRQKGFVFVEWPEKVTRREDLQAQATLTIEIVGSGRKIKLSK